MKVLVLNCGSSSVKYRLFEMDSEAILAQGMIERIGEGAPAHTHKSGANEWTREVDAEDHVQAMRLVAKALMNAETGCIADASEVSAVGHRVVHGGEEFSGPALIDDQVEAAIERLAPLAPLHNPPNLAGIRAARRTFPHARHVAVFDTAFHRTMPEHARVYGVPYAFYERAGVRRYGFHGTSCRFVAQRAAELIGIGKGELNAIICHLGNGCSVTAVRSGLSVDTSMGMTPMEGLLMGTRSGDIDPGAVFHMIREFGMRPEQVEEMLTKKGGLLGLSGLSNDVRLLLEAAPANRRAKLALDVFAYRARKYIGAYMAVVGRPHAIIFTAGIGENSAVLRREICAGLEALEVKLDESANEACSGEGRISAPDSKVQIWVIPTNEELMIAKDTAAIASGSDVDGALRDRVAPDGATGR